MSESIRVFLADDHAVVREGLAALIETEEDIEVVGTAENGEEAVRRVLQFEPDVTLLDLHMPRKGGLEAIVEIREELPDARILVLTSFGDDENVFTATKNGALGYLLKDTPRMTSYARFGIFITANQRCIRTLRSRLFRN